MIFVSKLQDVQERRSNGSVKDYVEIGLEVGWETSFKTNGELVEQAVPVRNGYGPVGSDVARCQGEQLANGLGGWESGLILGDLAQLAVVGFDIVIGVNQPPNVGRELEKGGQVFPMNMPGLALSQKAERLDRVMGVAQKRQKRP